jgi:hypothetical protein
MYRDPEIGILKSAFSRTTYVRFREMCPSIGHIYVSMYRDSGMCVHKGHFCVWGGVSLHWALLWKHLRESEMGIQKGAFLRTMYVRLGKCVLALGIFMEACVEALKWAYT